MAGMKRIPLREIKKHCDSFPVKYAALTAIGVPTGCRISEIIPLKRRDLIDENGCFKEKVCFINLKNGKVKTKKIMIQKVFKHYIIRHLNDEAERGYVSPDDYVFRGQCGQHLSRHTVYQFFYRTLGRGHGTHWMRKTFGYEIFNYFLRQNPADPMRALETTRRALHHQRIDTTVKYLGLEEDNIEEAQNNIFGKIGEKEYAGE